MAGIPEPKTKPYASVKHYEMHTASIELTGETHGHNQLTHFMSEHLGKQPTVQPRFM